MIQSENLSMEFGRKKVLKNISLKIDKGEIVGILGPNGSGKTTLMKIVAGMIKPESGNVFIQGEYPSPKTKARVSYLSDSNYIPEGYTVMETLEFYETFYEDFDRKIFMDNLKQLGLDEEIRSRVKRLSKGMQQKLRLALNMARQSQVYLLDEPLGGIDPLAREEILDTLIDSMALEATMVITTHLVAEVEQILTRVLFIHEGTIIGDYNCEDLRQQEGKSVEEKYKEVFRNVKNNGIHH